MSQKISLVNNTIIYTIGNLGSKILSFLLLPYFSYYLSISELGQYDLIITCLNLFLPVVSFQISDALYRWLLEANGNHEEEAKVLKNGIVAVLFFNILFQVVIFILSWLMSDTYITKYILEFSLLIASSSLLLVCQQSVRGLMDTRSYSASGLLNSLSVLVLSLLFLRIDPFSDNISNILFASIISNFLATLLLVISILYRYKNFKINTKIDRPLVKSMIIYSFPLILNSLSWWFINGSSRFIILNFLDVDSNGIFAVASKLPALITIINSIFILAWQDLAISSDDENNNYGKLFQGYFIFNISLALVLIASSSILTRLLFDEKFYEAWKYSPLLYLAASFSSLSAFIGASYLKVKKTRGILITSLISAAVNIILTILLIPAIGLYAPSLGAFVSFTVMYLVRKRETNTILELSIRYKGIFILMALCLLFFVLLLLENLYINTILIIVSMLIFMYCNKEIIMSISKVIPIKRKDG